jgi:hypothetical protein
MSPKGFAAVAELIGDPTLEAMLAVEAEQVRVAISNEKFRKKKGDRAQTRDAIKQLQAAARRFEVALNRVSGERLNLDVTIGLLTTMEAAQGTTHDVIEACISALKRHDFGGRPKDRAKVACASVVVKAWHKARGSVPSHNCEDLALACDALWIACGGTGDARDWSGHIRAAKRRPANGH